MKHINRKKGSALMLVMVMAIVVMGIIGTLLTKSATHAKYTRQQKALKSCHQAAQSGLQATTLAIREFLNNNQRPTEVHGNCSNWDSVVVLVDDNGTEEWFELATGNDNPASFNTLARRVYDQALANTPIRQRDNNDFRVRLTAVQSIQNPSENDFDVVSVGVFDREATAFRGLIMQVRSNTNGIIPRNAADELLEIGGSAQVLSFPEPGKALFASNGDINLSVPFLGEIHPGPDGVLNGSENVVPPVGQTVEEATSNLNKPFELPPVEIDFPQTSPSNGNFKKGDHNLSGVNHFTDLTVKGTLNIAGDTEIYVQGDLTINAGGGIVIPQGATLKLFISGKATFNGHSVTNETIDPQNLQVKIAHISTSSSTDDVKLNGTSDFYGIMYAPDANVKILGTNQFFGNIAANRIRITGNAGFSDFINGNPQSEGEGNFVFVLHTGGIHRTSVN
ncbi:hypothetical protein [Candidatus Uabimicrobium sp. HlEnr_7]|uniref:DUF7305 domain-containing protein n=1 Tax=Candidatus Uabimicrobium helgolandensis TaxID=3095367 RepID=UPI003557F7EF